jgi:hypothetical protein
MVFLGAGGISGRLMKLIFMGTRFLGLTTAAILLPALLARCAPLGPNQAALNRGVPVRFVHVDAAAASVCVAGSFNGWAEGADCMRRDGSTWTLALTLPPGRYEYGFVIDGRSWQPDPGAILLEDSGFGRLNSILIVE